MAYPNKKKISKICSIFFSLLIFLFSCKDKEKRNSWHHFCKSCKVFDDSEATKKPSLSHEYTSSHKSVSVQRCHVHPLPLTHAVTFVFSSLKCNLNPPPSYLTSCSVLFMISCSVISFDFWGTLLLFRGSKWHQQLICASDFIT